MDENVPRSVAELLARRGHDVYQVREHVPGGSADHVVASLVEDCRGVIVTFDRHFENIVHRSNRESHLRYPNVGRLKFECPEPDAAGRLPDLLPLIEYEYRARRLETDRRLIAAISKTYIKVLR
jgi:hypothetical protein